MSLRIVKNKMSLMYEIADVLNPILKEHEAVRTTPSWVKNVEYFSVCTKSREGSWPFEKDVIEYHVYFEEWSEDFILADAMDERGEEIIREFMKVDPYDREIHLSLSQTNTEEP